MFLPEGSTVSGQTAWAQRVGEKKCLLSVSFDNKNGRFIPLGVLLLLISVFLYFIPAIVAASKNKRNSGAIFGLNLLLGWTIVGWVVSLVWALTNDAEAPAVPQNAIAVQPRTQIQSPSAQKKCPDCAEMVLDEARKCRFCGHEFNPAGLLS